MCVVSMIGDHYTDKWRQEWPWGTQPSPNPGILPQQQPQKTMEEWANIINPPVRKNDFDSLKKEVEEMKSLLLKALEYDKKNNEPHCEMAEKVALLKAVAKMVGVSLEDVFGADNGEPIL